MRSGVHRIRLPLKRDCDTYSHNISGHEITLSVGKYEDGTVGEIFLDLGKEGSDVSGWCNMFSIAVSLGLQHGVPLQKYIHTFRKMRFGFSDAEYTSVPDFVMQLLESEYAKSND